MIGLRIGFTIYSAWLTAATILGFSIALKASGVDDAALGFGFEEQFSIVLLWVSMGVYIATSWWLKNPLFAAIFFWPLGAIGAEQASKGRTMIYW